MVFFFQAEDGIRDDLVTGVQTCALPIFRDHAAHVEVNGVAEALASGARADGRIEAEQNRRSEERRVGKECRSRRSEYHDNKQQEPVDGEIPLANQWRPDEQASEKREGV